MNSTFVLTVGQLNKIVRSTLEGVPALARLWVSGEISNFKFHYSGHLYFSLKDETASIRCVMFAAAASRLRFLPQDGMKVICRGRISLYEKDGQYQFYAEDMQPDGLGAEHLSFLQLKEKLENEGLFDLSQKKALPLYPKHISVLTSPNGAVWHDIVNVISRRWPLTQVCLFPVPVQGETACDLLCEQFQRAVQNHDTDVILLARGGGSSEDLSVFNKERLVRLVANSPIPVISALGHETDYTLCDFAADRRAPTPSAAAELVVPDRNDLSATIFGLRKRITHAVQKCVEAHRAAYQRFLSSAFPADQALVYQNYRKRLEHCMQRVEVSYCNLCSTQKNRFEKELYRLQILNPLSRLSGGYAYVTKDQQAVLKADDLQIEDTIKVNFSDSSVICQVVEKG